MKILSVRQPFAWLLASSVKDVENRTWETKYRGPLLIHASKTIDVEGIEWVRDEFPEIVLPDAFDVGGVVGRAHLVDCVRQSSSPWFFGPFGFELEIREPTPFIPCRGMPGLFDAPADVLEALRRAQ